LIAIFVSRGTKTAFIDAGVQGMWRSVMFVVCVVVLAVLASSPEGAAAYSLPGATEIRALLPGSGADSENGEPAALLLMGAALIGAAWAARRHTRTS
jgi:hypothetical protein